jgi:hypothetical protein
MDEINKIFLSPSFASALDNVNLDINKDFITRTMVTFIGGNDTDTLVYIIKYYLNYYHEDFLQQNIAFFKAVKFFIYYKVGYDYTKLRIVEKFFYRFLYVADKLFAKAKATGKPQAAPENQTVELTREEIALEEPYKNCLKKLFIESKIFSRKRLNPLTAKGDEKLSGFFKIFEKAIIEPSRLSRQEYKKQGNRLYENEAIPDLSPTDKQEEKIKKSIEKLLQQYSKDKHAYDYIKDVILKGVKLKTDTPPAAAAAGGKGKRRRRINGGTHDRTLIYLIVKYCGYTIFDYNIEPLANGLYTVDILAFKEYSNFDKAILPEFKDIEDTRKFGSSIKTGRLVNAYKNAFKNIPIPTSLYDSGGLPPVAEYIKHLTTPHPNTNTDVDERKFILSILKEKYAKNPFISINNTLEKAVL